MARVKKSGLGKGLDSLIPDSLGIDNVDKSENEPVILKTTEIEPNRSQPRKEFDEKALEELADSISQVGIIQPILVQKREDYYEIIAGERRWRAAKKAGLKEVPVIIKNYTEKEIFEIALIENIQRENLNPIEEANAYKQLIEEHNLKQEELAQRVSKSRAAITNSMRLLKLNEEVQQMVVNKEISSGHARTLLSIEDLDLQIYVAKKIVEQNLSVRDTEKLVKTILKPDKKDKKEKKTEKNAVYIDLEKKMAGKIGSKVIINEKEAGKGKLEIEYYSIDELDRIYELLMSVTD